MSFPKCPHRNNRHSVSWLCCFCRRGSNLSLLLDVSSLGAEPVCSVSTPKEVWIQLLHTSSRPLTHSVLQQAAMDISTLNVEYQVTQRLLDLSQNHFLMFLLFVCWIGTHAIKVNHPFPFSFFNIFYLLSLLSRTNVPSQIPGMCKPTWQ